MIIIKNFFGKVSPYLATLLILILIGFSVYTNKTSSQSRQDLGEFLLYPNVKEVVKSKKVVSVQSTAQENSINDPTDTISKDGAITTPENVSSTTEGKDILVNTSEDENVVYLASLAPVEIYKEGLSEDSDSCDYKNHTVLDGETVESIAGIYALSVNTVLFENDLKPDDIIKPGDNLVVPCLTNAAKHTIKKGETLSGIAKYHELEPEKIQTFNNIDDPSALKENDVLIIPDSARVKELIEDQLAAAEAEKAKIAAAEAKKRQAAATAAALKKKSSSSRSSSSPSYASSTTKRGSYILPVGGRVNYRRGIHAHNGIDISGNGGAGVAAAASGTVTKAACGWNGGYGCVVEIRHGNGTTTRYAHLRSGSISVSRGQKVSQGRIIGSVGSTGRSTGPHLHFEVHGARNPYLG